MTRIGDGAGGLAAEGQRIGQPREPVADHIAELWAHGFEAMRLGNGWRLLVNPWLGGTPVQFALICPAGGVALLEIEPVWTPEAPALFRAHLAEAGFEHHFPGHLPVIHRRLRAGELRQMEMLLAEAFVWLEPMTIKATDRWEDAVEALLTPPPAQATTGETTDPGLTPPRAPSPDRTASLAARAAGQAGNRTEMRVAALALMVLAGSFALLPHNAGSGLNTASGARAMNGAAVVTAAPPAPEVQPPVLARVEAVTATPLPALAVPSIPEALLPPAPSAVAAMVPTAPDLMIPPPAPEALPPLPVPSLPPAVVAIATPPGPEAIAPGLAASGPVRPAPQIFGPVLPEPMPPLPEPPEGMAAPSPVHPNVPPPETLLPQALPPQGLPPQALPDVAGQGRSIAMGTSPSSSLPAEPPSTPPGPEQQEALFAWVQPAPPGQAAVPSPQVQPVAAMPPAAAAQALAMSPSEIETARRRGEELAALGDISGARRFLERAALAGNGPAAWAMAESFDPRVLAARRVMGLSPDPHAALEWYRRALALGVIASAPRIAILEASR